MNRLMAMIATAILIGTSAEAADWTPAGKLVVGVESNNAFALGDGRVVSVGIPTLLNWWAPTTQVWSPITKKWAATASAAPLPDLVQPVPVMLSDGRILVTGFCRSSCGNGSNAEIYDPASDSWSRPGQMRTGRYQHSATLLADGRVLVAGGCVAYGCAVDTDSAEIFDPGANTFSAVRRMKIHRAGQTATLLADGHVLVAGGGNSSGLLAENETYDPVTNKWAVNQPMKHAHMIHSAARMQDGRVLVAGGIGSYGLPDSSADVFDPSTGNWTPVGSMGQPREYFQMLTLKDGRVLIAGGFSYKGELFTMLSSAKVFDPSTNKFTKTRRMHHEREEFSMAMLPDGTVMAVGGDAHLDGRIKVPGESEIYVP